MAERNGGISRRELLTDPRAVLTSILTPKGDHDRAAVVSPSGEVLIDSVGEKPAEARVQEEDVDSKDRRDFLLKSGPREALRWLGVGMMLRRALAVSPLGLLMQLGEEGVRRGWLNTDKGPHKFWASGTNFWFPLSPGIAKNEGIITLIPSLELHDNVVERVFGRKSKAAQWEKDREADVLRHNPDADGWAGHCREVMIVGHFEPKPSSAVSPFEGQRATFPLRLGLLVALYSGRTPAILFSTNPAEFPKVLEFAAAKGRTVIGNIPERGQGGSWFKFIKEVKSDFSRVRAANISRRDRDYPVSQIESLQFFVFDDHSQAIDPRSNAFAAHRKNPELNEKVVRAIVTGKKLR